MLHSKLSLLVLAMLWIAPLCGQDIIEKIDGEIIRCQITEVTEEVIKYETYLVSSGAVYEINKSEVAYIKYENGKKKRFNKSQKRGDNNGVGGNLVLGAGYTRIADIDFSRGGSLMNINLELLKNDQKLGIMIPFYYSIEGDNTLGIGVGLNFYKGASKIRPFFGPEVFTFYNLDFDVGSAFGGGNIGVAYHPIPDICLSAHVGAGYSIFYGEDVSGEGEAYSKLGVTIGLHF